MRMNFKIDRSVVIALAIIAFLVVAFQVVFTTCLSKSDTEMCRFVFNIGQGANLSGEAEIMDIK